MSEFFDGLIEGLEQASKVLKGKKNGMRTTTLIFVPNVEVTPSQIKALRKKLGLSQSALADLLDVRVITVRKWEQGHNRPEGPSRRLLQAMQIDGLSFVEKFVRRTEAGDRRRPRAGGKQSRRA